MSHYEERLERDLATIRTRVAAVGAQVERALTNAVHAVLTLDRALSSATVLGDLPINREIREIDRGCHAFVARHLPSAGHLRFVSSVLRLNVALERIGDYAVAISREAIQLSTAPPEAVCRDIELLADQNTRMLRQSMLAFNKANAEMARGAIGLSGQLGSTFDRVFADLLREGEKGQRPVRDLFALLVVFNRLGRVGDQAKNICEETLFTVTGETKQPKRYRVLFIDERNDCASQLAELYARKAFPNSGEFSSAGWNPAPEVQEACRSFLDDRGYDATTARPGPLSRIHEELAEHHVIVSLQGDPREHMGPPPFHTVLLVWDVGSLPPDGDASGIRAALESMMGRIANGVGELMETLTGEGAD